MKNDRGSDNQQITEQKTAIPLPPGVLVPDGEDEPVPGQWIPKDGGGEPVFTADPL